MNFYILVLEILLIIISLFMYYIIKKVQKSQIKNIFIVLLAISLWISLFLVLQYWLNRWFNIPLIYFEYFMYIGTCFLPVALLFTGIIFANTKISFRKSYLLLFIIPILSLIMLWTNNLHHLFYVNYSINMDETIFGHYFNIHSIYTYILYFIALFNLIKYSIKNSGIFSKQAILIIIGCLLPIIVNGLGSLKVIPTSIYLTPICFSFTILLLAFAIFKFNFLRVTPIALQKIVDRISDSYIVINENNVITDFNQTFLETFNVKSNNVRNRDFGELLKSYDFNVGELTIILDNAKHSSETFILEKHFENLNKYFHIEINSISNKGNFLGILILFKDTTQHMNDMQTIKDNQEMLVESERLASLGQMIGGIAHNLKTPIMSISGAAEGLNDLIKEYEASVGDSEVTVEDHHAIANDMKVWLDKIKAHLSYMSDVITAVKGQSVTFSDDQITDFGIDEALKMVSILMKHELNRDLVSLNIENNVSSDLFIHGNINSLVQVINNVVSNAIQASANATNKVIDLSVNKKDNNIIISVKDYGFGIPKSVQETLFKEMITTKGKNGTGLGLFMSYSNIKAHFKGDITFTTEEGKGTEFDIILPV